jgi:hypothetical protein
MAFPARRGLVLALLFGSLSAILAAQRPGVPAASARSRAAASKEKTPGDIALRFPGHEPSIRWDSAGNLHMVFVREEGNRQRLYYVRGGSNPRAISPEESRVDSRGEMGPSLEVLPGGKLVVVYTVALPGERSSQLEAQRSEDGGATWSTPVPINDDGKMGSHGFASTAVDSSGELLVAWLDRRSGQEGVVFSRSRDGVRFAANKIVDPRTCQCCVTNVAAGHSGNFWIAYRGLSGKDLRDVALVRGEAPRFEFAPPLTVSADDWHINGCPESGPRMALEKDGTLWVTWFTGAGPGVFVARSKDGGRTFSPRARIAPAPGETRLANHPDIAVLPDGTVAVVYESQSTIFGRTLERDRESWSAPVKLVEEASYARIASGAGKSALSFTGRNGNDTVAAASSAPLARLTASSLPAARSAAASAGR